MANTLVLLEKVTVGAAGAASITFSNIPQTGYNDLVVKMSIKTTSANRSDAVVIKPNGSAANGTAKRLYGNGASATSDSLSVVDGGQADGNSSAVTSTWSNGEVYIPNYASSNYKSMSVDAVSEGNETTAYAELGATLWSSTAAITSLNISCTSNLAQYSTFSLYGVSNVNTTPLVAPKATGGDIIQTDGTYWYHAFINSGSFTPAVGLTCDYLVVAGGGGGAKGSQGGGGAGGYRTSIGGSALSLSITNYTVTIGAGGAGGTSTSAYAANGVDSVFSSITSTGGGAGGYGGSVVGANGGSGGGGSAGTATAGGSATSGQGNNGGVGYNMASGAGGGGGGGAGATGGNAVYSPEAAGNGGAGSNSASAWATATSTGVSGYYAGGGGGGGFTTVTTRGTGGSGGGGNGGNNTAGSAGTDNTGGGGGGGGYNGASVNGYNGGSGIVIVRYTV